LASRYRAISASVTDTRSVTFRRMTRWTRIESRMRFFIASIVTPRASRTFSSSARLGTLSRFIRSATSSSISPSSTTIFSRSASWSWRRLSIIRVMNCWTSSSVGGPAPACLFSYR
jgi:hypothetical protein